MKKFGWPQWIIVFALIAMFVFTAAAPAAASGNIGDNGKPQKTAVEQSGPGGGILSTVSKYMGKATKQLDEAGQGLLSIPGLLEEIIIRAQDPDYRMLWAEMAGKILLVLLAGFFAEWITRRILRNQRPLVEKRETEYFSMRTLLAAFRLFIDILPIAAFAIVAYGVVPFTGPRDETQLIALALINARVLAKIILAVFRMLLVPAAPSLRLLSIDKEMARQFYLRLRRIVGLGVYGFFIAEAALLMGMPEALYVFVAKFLGLAITAMLVFLVLQNKNEVAVWLHGIKAVPGEDDEKETKQKWIHTLLTLRSRLADFWHIAAVLLIVALFATWALEIEGGLFFLASGLAMTAGVIAVAGQLVGLADKSTDRLFQIREDRKAAYPDLENRINRYHPVVRNLLKAIVYIVAVFAILEVWGLGTLGWLFSPAGRNALVDLITLALIIAGAFLVWEIVSATIERSLAHETEKMTASPRKQTLLPLLKTVVRIALVVFAAMLLLSQIGITIAPLLAGAGILGLAVGFGAQSLVKDVITGMFILLEDAISVGDWVDAGGYSGTVEHLTVRTVTLRDLSGTLIVVPFGEVTTVSNYNRDYGYALIDAGVAYREHYGDVVQALQDVAIELRNDEYWGPLITDDLELFGTNDLSDSAVEIRVRLKTLPMRHFGVRRAFLERMKRVFDERGIEIPFPHRTVWFGVDKEGTAPPLYIASNEEQQDASAPQHAAAEPEVQMASESTASTDVIEEKEEKEEKEQADPQENPEESKP
ncbi:MAG: mechanosensitive ion channel family protein [Thermodesulfobacteriota bacterium]